MRETADGRVAEAAHKTIVILPKAGSTQSAIN